MGLRRIVSSLTGRIVLVTFAVSLIAVLVTAVVSLQVVQSVAENQARQQLRAQANILVSESRASTTQVERLTQRVAELGERFAVIQPDGTVVGAARTSVGPDVVSRVLAGQSVSATSTVGGKDAVLVALPRPGGGGIAGVRKVADIKAGNAELIRWIVVALAAGLVTAMVAGTLLSRRIGRPLTQLASSARELAHGDRGVDIRRQSVAEIEDIALALRTLDVALATSEERQRDFLLSVSHEIRTPLTAIRGYAEALADGVIPAGEVAGVGTTLTAEAERLRRFVDDLLELARLEADDFPIYPLEFDVRETLLRASRAWGGASDRLGAQLRTDLPPQALLIVSDEMRVRQIVDGLLENALR
ncbi:MAG: sensor histidine kinase, partial [Actinomycetales bacterium]